MHTSRAVHRVLVLATGLLVVASCLLAGVAWRLAQGPIDLGPIADRVRAAIDDDGAPVRLSFEGLALAWEGFHKGVDYPLDLRLTNLSVTDPTGRRLVAAPDAHLTFSFAGLMLGRFVPRTIEVDHAHVVLTREASGAVNIGLDADGDNGDTFDLRQLSRPASTDHGRSHNILDQIHRAHFLGTQITLRDQASGLEVRTPGMDVDLVRAKDGHIDGNLRAPITAGGQTADVKAALRIASASGGELTVSVTPIRPAVIMPALAAGDFPVSLAMTVAFDAAFRPGRVQAEVTMGTGFIRIADGAVPIRSGTIALSGTRDRIDIRTAHFDLAHAPGASPEVVDVSGTVLHVSDRFTAALAVRVGQFDIADLPHIWPPSISPNARGWVTEHVTAGTVTKASASLALEADDSLHDIVLTRATADLDGANGTFTWIDNIPAVEQTEVHLHLTDPDTLDIVVPSGRQHIRNGGSDLLIRGGQMRISGLSLKDQVAVIRTQVDGPVASALTLLKEPRLHLLSDRPLGLRTGGGDVSATLDLTFPLETKLRADDIQLHADAHLKDVRLLEVAAGRDLTGAVADLAIDKDGLTLKGRGNWASIPVVLDGHMDFRDGAADQVVQKITATGQPDVRQLDAAGFHMSDFVSGAIPMSVVMTQRRSGDGTVAIGGDLSDAGLTFSPLGWSKPTGAGANASAVLVMSHDKLVRIDRITARGDGLAVAGSAVLTEGAIRTIQLDTIRLGRTQGHGTIHLGGNDLMNIVLQGSQIDLSPKLVEKTPEDDPADKSPIITPPWTVDARFDKALLANGETATGFLVKASGAGEAILGVDAVGALQGGAAYTVRIEQRDGKRRLHVETKDAGRLLRGADAVRVMQSGHLIIDGTFETPYRMQPLAGTATIDDVVVRNSPVLGKLLQAITLYGLVDVLSGPGMAFSRVVVPFRYQGGGLNLEDARAANPSLGLTAQGRIGLASERMMISGTIVPAYFFNSLLGNLPVVGKLFSPEKGGGVFAARFGVSGPIDDAVITINPISALTPGFLRDIFGIFDRKSDEPGQRP